MKWFNSGMGYGFIKPNGGDRDVFVHITAVERGGLDTLSEGQALEYQVVQPAAASSPNASSQLQ